MKLRKKLFPLLIGLGAFGWAPVLAKGSPCLPEIEFWYGERQAFGELGDPQPLLNVLGSIAPAEEVKEASYRLNEGTFAPLPLGIDLRRLARPGDFNIEIDREALEAGENRVEVRARLEGGQEIVGSMVVEYAPDKSWPLPYRIDWSEVERIQDVAEIVDGKWTLSERGVRTAEPYYDRVIAVGDQSWTDYEVMVDVTYHRLLGDLEGNSLKGPPYLDHAHASLALRWAGHPEDGKSPRVEWRNIGGLAMLRADVKDADRGSYWWLHFARKRSDAGPVQVYSEGREDVERRLRIELDTPYRYRARVETVSPTRSRYSMKVWRVGDREPEVWDLVGEDREENVASGSLLLVVHHADVTFGNLEVREL